MASEIYSNAFREYLVQLADEIGADRKKPPKIEDHMLITVHPDDRAATITIKATAQRCGVPSSPTIKLAVVRLAHKSWTRYVMLAPDQNNDNPIYLDSADHIIEKALDWCNDAIARQAWPNALDVRAYYPALRAVTPETQAQKPTRPSRIARLRNRLQGGGNAPEPDTE